jgi:uncharacterized protein YecE (DUF72 family)
MMIYVGCAGWSIPWQQATAFPGEGTHLQRYARVLPAVEINTSFYRTHKPATYARWAASTPEHFRFAVKVHRNITHYKRLRQPELLDDFLAGVMQLGGKLGVLLLQLPPSLTLEMETATRFFEHLRGQFDGAVACEPRNASWFTPEADDLLNAYRIARAAVDPAPVAAGAAPGGWPGLCYVRLHGSPEIYRSAYSPAFLEELADNLLHWSQQASTWCIFNNTAAGAAIANALTLQAMLAGGEKASPVS